MQCPRFVIDYQVLWLGKSSTAQQLYAHLMSPAWLIVLKVYGAKKHIWASWIELIMSFYFFYSIDNDSQRQDWKTWTYDVRKIVNF